MKETKDFFFILSIRSNGDQMNALLQILHLIPISTPPSVDRNSALKQILTSDTSLSNTSLTNKDGMIGKYIHMAKKQKQDILPCFSPARNKAGLF